MIIEFVIRGVILSFQIIHLLFLYIVKIIYIIMTNSKDSQPSEPSGSEFGYVTTRKPIRLKPNIPSPRRQMPNTPSRRNRMDLTKASFSPIQITMKGLQNSLKKMINRVSEIEKSSP